jgi:hypothetical protein
MLTIAINLGDEPASFDMPEGDPLYAVGGIEDGAIAPASCVAWLS